MKKTITFIILFSLIFSSISVFAGANDQNYGQAKNNPIQGILNVLKDISELVGEIIQKFSDMKNNWAVEYVAELFSKGAIAGFPDGTFRPNGAVTRAEFVKIMVTSLGEDPGNYSAGHWATNYLNKAIEEGYIRKGEFDDPNKAITRAEMARMISRALEETPENIELLKNQLTDFARIGSEYKDHVAKVYAAGIITGYPDGSFGADKTATRAEASTMLVRLLNPEKRIIPEVKKVSKDFIEPELSVYFYKSKDAYDYFAIMVDNLEEYEKKAEYTFTVECISHPKINYHDRYSRIDGSLLNANVNMMERYKNNGIEADGAVYRLEDFRRWKPSGSKEQFSPKEGEAMKYKITLDNGKETREYYIELNFKYKEFRY